MAARVFAALSPEVRRAAVFGGQSPAEIAEIVSELDLDVVQLHEDPPLDLARSVKEATGRLVWAVVRVPEIVVDGGQAPAADRLAARIAELDGEVDAVLLDTLAVAGLGGSGRRFDWSLVGEAARPRRSRLVAAGGLAPETVGEAIAALRPDVVDVSSGVERATGLKDHERMRAFAQAVRRAAGDT